MKLFERFRRREKGCEWEDSCNCKGEKANICEECKWYRGIDSGYGWCKGLPQYSTVAWCRDVCALFKRGKK